MNALLQKFKALPRAAQWLVYLGLVLIAFFAVAMPLLSFSDSVGNNASTLEAAILRRNDFASSASGDGKYIVDSQTAFGSPLMPATAGLKPEAFTRAVDRILENHQVTDRNVTERKVAMTRDQALALHVPALDRLILEVSFEADPKTVIAILAELERSPEVAAVSRVKIDRTNIRNEEDRLVRATITPEAWIAASGSGSSGSDSSGPADGGMNP
jgi:hypothetical protein